MELFRGLHTLILGITCCFVLVFFTGCSDPAEKLSPDELISNASTEITRYDYDKAKNYARIAMKKSDEGSDHWVKANFLLAVCYHQEQPPGADNIKEAEKHYNAVIEKSPDSRLAAMSHMWIGRIAQARDYEGDEADIPAARQAYQKVIDGWPGTLEASEAKLRLANTYMETLDPGTAQVGIDLLEDWLKKNPDDPLAAGMWVYLAGSYNGTMKDKANSLRCYLNADKAGLLDPNGAGDIFWKIAQMSQQQGKREQAIQYYQKVILEAASSGLAFESQIELRKMGEVPPEIPTLKFFKEDPAASTQPSTTEGEAN